MAAPLLVAGAGIAGLSAAIALARRGRRVVVAERAAALTEVGAGLQLSPNAVHSLTALGLGPSVIDGAVRSDALTMISAMSGRAVAEVPLGRCPERYGAPYVVLPRPRLLAGLVEAATADPRIEILLDCAVRSLHDTGTGVRVETSRGPLEGEALIGADGVHSAVRREALAGGPPRPTGKVAYRATIDEAAAPATARHGTFLWMSRAAHLVHYPIGGRVNLVAIVDEGVDASKEIDWDAAAAADAVRRHFGGFAEPAASLLSAASGWRRWPLLAAAPPRWTAGRIGLVGDAAHAMLPFLAQGAAMAIEDAVVLAARLTAAPDVAAGLAAYERERRPRVARVVAAAESTGRVYHLSGPIAFARDTTLRLSGPGRLLARFDWLYRWRPPR